MIAVLVASDVHRIHMALIVVPGTALRWIEKRRAHVACAQLFDVRIAW